ncbi:MAG TPA: hypothetical protein VGV85_13615 [Longimicrobiaceae bacterium]|nr:hypothetical protein [Longimicrobiaceae bacterium]
MPLDVLRRWADNVATATSSRRAAKRFRMSVEGLRQFVRADTTPQERTLRKVGEAYLAELREERARAEPRKRSRKVAETRAAFGPARLEDDLRALLPRDREKAMEKVAAIFAPARRKAGARALEAALLRWIAERYPPSDGEKPAEGRKD